jgi:hypothetical protein
MSTNTVVKSISTYIPNAFIADAKRELTIWVEAKVSSMRLERWTFVRKVLKVRLTRG